MSKKEFHSRYSIEYLHPGEAGSRQQKKSGFILPLLFLSALVGAGFFLWKQGFINQFLQQNKVVAPITEVADENNLQLAIPKVSTPKEVVSPAVINKKSAAANAIQKVGRTNYSDRTGQEIFTDKCTYCHGKNGEGNLKEVYPKLQGQNAAYLLLQLQRMRDGQRENVNPAMFKIITKMDDDTLGKIARYVSKIPAPQNNLVEDKQKKLANKLQTLADQLLKEKAKNSQLQIQLEKSVAVSESFSKLYSDAVSNVNKNDKAFLKVVEGEKQRLVNVSTKQNSIGNSKTKPVRQAIAVEQVAKIRTTRQNNTFEIGSTTNQIDKIMSTMSNTSNYKPTVKTSTSNKRVYVDLNNTIQQSVNIQNKINQLVTEKDIPKTNFTRALKKEEKARKNAVRSVVVKKGDTLWKMAERAYGSGFKYPKILKANPSLKEGEVVHLFIGQVIRVPE